MSKSVGNSNFNEIKQNCNLINMQVYGENEKRGILKCPMTVVDIYFRSNPHRYLSGVTFRKVENNNNLHETPTRNII